MKVLIRVVFAALSLISIAALAGPATAPYNNTGNGPQQTYGGGG